MAEDLKVAVVLTGEAAVRAGLTSIAQETKKVAAETKAASAETKSYASTALPSVRSVTDALGQQVAQLRAQAAAMRTPEHQAYMRSQQALRAEIEALTRATTNQGAAVQGVSSSLSAAQAPTRSLSASWADLAGKWFLASQAIGLVGGAVSSLVEDSAKWQMMRNSISDTEGSASKAATTISSLVEAAKLPGLDLQPLSKGYVGFRSLNIEGEKAVRTMKAFGNAIALAGGGANEFERVNRQLLQMLGKGRVLQEDISIIAESMPRIRELTKEAFGTYDIEKIRESGVTANEFVDAVVAAAEKLPQASGNIKNSLDNASTAMSQFRDQLMPDEGIQAAVDGWTNTIEALTAVFKIIANPIDTTTGILSALRDEMYRTSGMTGEWLALRKKAKDQYGITDETGSATSSQALSISSFGAYSAIQAKKADDLAKKQGAALLETGKSLAKTDLAVALQIEREKWKGRIALFQEGSESYNQVMRAQAIEEDRIRKQFAQKPGEKSAVNAGWMEGDQSFSKSYGMTYEAYRSTTGSSGVNSEQDTSMLTGAQKGSRQDAAKKLHDEVQRISEKNLADNQRLEANAQKIRMDWESALLEKKKAAHEEEMKLIRERADVGQKLVADQAYAVLQGEFTKQGALNATKDVAFRAIADTTTKWIEEQILKMVFAKSAEAASTTASVAQAAIVTSAWAPASMATSIGTFGASTAAGSASWFTAMTAAQGYSMMPHERGGMMFGAGLKQREEMFTPLTPGRVTPIHNSSSVTNHNTTNAQRITIVTGLSESGLHRALAKVGINGTRSSRG